MNTPRINVTPLIDVLLVLLIIFMVVTPIKPSRFAARVPSEPKGQANVDPDPLTLVVTLDASGSVSLNQKLAANDVDDTDGLSDQLAGIFRLRERNGTYSSDGSHIERTVFIKAPKRVGYGSVAKIVDAVKVGGADPISLQIDRLD